MLVKEGETIASVKMLFEAMNFVAECYFGCPLSPGCLVFDHSDSFMGGKILVWPNAGDTTCYVLFCSPH
jgi:hypothetical protein